MNSGVFLRACLESVAAQGDVIEKHIVMDGGSNDGTMRILEEYSRRYRHLVWVSESDEGQSEALNNALQRVETPFFGWLNADDLYLPGKLKALTNVSGNASGADSSIVYGDYECIDADGKLLKRRRQPSFDLHDCIYGYLTVQNCAALFNTARLREAGGFDNRLRFAMDYDAVLKLALRGPVVHVREYIGQFRIHGGSKTSFMQDTCRKETSRIRETYSGVGVGGLKSRFLISKARVAFRMAREGCIWCRLGLNI